MSPCLNIAAMKKAKTPNTRCKNVRTRISLSGNPAIAKKIRISKGTHKLKT